VKQLEGVTIAAALNVILKLAIQPTVLADENNLLKLYNLKVTCNKFSATGHGNLRKTNGH
jgi:hypothetical protein